MILQIIDTAAIAIGIPGILLLTLLFIAVSVSTGIITFRIRTKAYRSGRENEEESNDTGENDS